MGGTLRFDRGRFVTGQLVTGRLVTGRFSWRDVVAPAVLLLTAPMGTYRASHVQESWTRTPDALAYVLVVLACLSLLGARRWPRVVLGVCGAATVAYLVIGYPYGPILLPGLLAVFFLATRVDPRTAAAPIGGFWLAVALTPLARDGDALLSDPWLPGWTAAVAAAAAIGVARRVRRTSAAEVRAEQLRRAASEERLRMAQELHDSVGHGLAVIAMQSGVALHVIDGDASKVRASLEAIRATSRASLDELRAQLDVMRQVGEPSRRPSPGVADLPILVERVRAAGLEVRLQLGPAAAAVIAARPDLDAVAYRIVQESLTNVLRHASATGADVRLNRHDDVVVLEVVDDGRGAAATGDDPSAARAGTGIRSMLDRARSLDGSLEAGPRPEGGFRVRASIPLAGSTTGAEAGVDA